MENKKRLIDADDPRRRRFLFLWREEKRRMKFSNWTLDSLIEYLIAMKSAPSDRLDHTCVPRVRGEIFVENGERKNDSNE